MQKVLGFAGDFFICNYLKLFLQIRLHCPDGVSAVADAFLFGEFHLREGAVESVGNKERVVAESHVACGRKVDLSAAFPFVNLGLGHGPLAVYLGDLLVRKCAEVAGAAVLDSFQLLHQLVVVRLVVAVIAAVAGAVDTRFAVQREYLKAGIVGEDACLDVLFAKPLGECLI